MFNKIQKAVSEEPEDVPGEKLDARVTGNLVDFDHDVSGVIGDDHNVEVGWKPLGLLGL